MGYNDVHAEVIQALADGKITGLETLITRRIPFADVVEDGILTLLNEKDTQSEFVACSRDAVSETETPSVKILVHP